MKYSIIVPIYNAENTLERCLDSIVFQAQGDFEVILINDGSQDSTDQICKAYEANHSMITYKAKQNEGVSAARNDGIRLSRGNYLVFVDSDDYLEPGFLKKADELLGEYDYDLTLFSYYKEKSGVKNQSFHNTLRCTERLNTFRILGRMISDKRINAPCAKVYKTEIIKKNHLLFTPGVSIGEDRAFNMKYALYMSSIAVSDFPGYTISLDNENSLSRGKKPRLKQELEAADRDIRKQMEICPLSKKERHFLEDAMNFGEYSEVYSDAKRMHRECVTPKKRRTSIREACKAINGRKLSFPKTVYSFMIVIPVKLQCVRMIDLVANVLARR